MHFHIEPLGKIVSHADRFANVVESDLFSDDRIVFSSETVIKVESPGAFFPDTKLTVYTLEECEDDGSCPLDLDQVVYDDRLYQQ